MVNPDRLKNLILSCVKIFAIVVFSLLAIALTLSQTGAPPQGGDMSRKSDQPPGWKDVDRLISEQKLEEASAATEKIRLAAQKAGNQEEWTRALIKEVQLRIALHGYETAVRFLKEQSWPEGSLNRAALNLFYAHSLVAYYRAYSWEINQREKVETRGAVDLKAWTKDQIFAEAQKAYELVWQQRVALGKEPIARLAEYLDRNTYPQGIRDTLRDAVSYLYVELLSDTSMWRPEESNEVYRLNLKDLLAVNTIVGRNDSFLLDPSVHPLMKICRILGDVETWHAENAQRGAALEARLERLRRLHASFTEGSDRALILQDLEKRLPEYRQVDWWAMGKALQAEFIQAQDDSQKLVHARSIAQEGYKAYPDAIGGKRCYSILKNIEAPLFGLASMTTDGPGKRSVEVNHKNLAMLYFRAYPYDVERRLETARDYNLLPNGRELQGILRT